MHIIFICQQYCNRPGKIHKKKIGGCGSAVASRRLSKTPQWKHHWDGYKPGGCEAWDMFPDGKMTEGAGSAIFSEKVSPQPSCCGEALWGHWSQPSGDPGVLPEGRHPSGEEVCAALCIRDNGEGQVRSASQFSLKR